MSGGWGLAEQRAPRCMPFFAGAVAPYVGRAVSTSAFRDFGWGGAPPLTRREAAAPGAWGACQRRHRAARWGSAASSSAVRKTCGPDRPRPRSPPPSIGLSASVSPIGYRCSWGPRPILLLVIAISIAIIIAIVTITPRPPPSPSTSRARNDHAAGARRPKQTRTSPGKFWFALGLACARLRRLPIMDPVLPRLNKA